MANIWLTNIDPKDKMMILVAGGGAISMEDLQYAASIAEDETFAASALVSLNHDRRIEAGLEFDTSMPMWAINAATDYDSAQFRTELMKDIEGEGQGVVNTLVATGGFELAVTEYNDEDYVAADYEPGHTLLTDDTENLGWIKPSPVDYSNVTTVGCVSYGIETQRVGVNRARLRLGQKALLRFWTMFHPPVVITS